LVVRVGKGSHGPAPVWSLGASHGLSKFYYQFCANLVSVPGEKLGLRSPPPLPPVAPITCIHPQTELKTDSGRKAESFEVFIAFNVAVTIS